MNKLKFNSESVFFPSMQEGKYSSMRCDRLEFECEQEKSSKFHGRPTQRTDYLCMSCPTNDLLSYY